MNTIPSRKPKRVKEFFLASLLVRVPGRGEPLFFCAHMDTVPVPAGLLEVVIGQREAGEILADDRRLAVISATGSTRMGREVAPRVAARFGKAILELGGNNAVIYLSPPS